MRFKRLSYLMARSWDLLHREYRTRVRVAMGLKVWIFLLFFFWDFFFFFLLLMFFFSYLIPLRSNFLYFLLILVYFFEFCYEFVNRFEGISIRMFLLSSRSDQLLLNWKVCYDLCDGSSISSNFFLDSPKFSYFVPDLSDSWDRAGN